MAEQVKRLPSRIVQYDNCDQVALCENGSVWWYEQRGKTWRQMHPPHEPPTHAGDLAEALEVLRNLMNKSTLRFGCDISVRAFQRAESLLEKHGIEPWDDEDSGTTFTEEDLRK